MKKTLIVTLFLFLFISLALAQEITDMRVQLINKRYEISFSLPGEYAGGSDFDVFFYAREIGTEPWFKMVTLLGPYTKLSGFSRFTTLWDPFFDFRKDGRYEFRLFAVRLANTNPGYRYDQTSAVGLLHVRSDQPNVRLYIAGNEVLGKGAIALPAGAYQTEAKLNGKVVSTATANVYAFEYAEVDLSPRYGWLTLESPHANAAYTVNSQTMSEVNGMKLQVGSYPVTITVPQPNTAYPALTQTTNLEIEEGKTTRYRFDIPYGTISLSSDESSAKYTINGKVYSNVTDMRVKPQDIDLVTEVTAFPGTRAITKQERVRVEAGKHTQHQVMFNVQYGTLTVTSNRADARIWINDIEHKSVNNLRIPAGAYKVVVTSNNPKGSTERSVVVNAGSHRGEYLPIADHVATASTTPASTTPAKPKSSPREISDFSIRYEQVYFPTVPQSFFDSDINTAGWEVADGLVIGGLNLKQYIGSNPTYYISLHGFDGMHFLRVRSTGKTAFSTDMLAIGLGLGFHAGRTLGFVVGIKGALTYQSPIDRLMFLDGTKLIYVTSFDDWKDSDGKRHHSIYSWAWGASATADAELFIGILKVMQLYVRGSLKESTTSGGKWYVKSQVTAWEQNLNASTPNPVYDSRLPSRNLIFERGSATIGLGLRFFFN